MSEAYDYCINLGELMPLQKKAMEKEVKEDMAQGVSKKQAKEMLFEVPYRVMRREGFKEIFCNHPNGCIDKKGCPVRKMIVNEKDLTEEVIVNLAGRDAFDLSVKRSADDLSEKAGYNVAEKNAKERAIGYWKIAMHEGKQEALEEIMVK